MSSIYYKILFVICICFIGLSSCNDLEVNAGTTFVQINSTTNSTHAIDVIEIGVEGNAEVIFLLDGENTTQRFVEAHEKIGSKQKFTLIGLRYVDENKRTRDFTISKLEEESGKAEDFMKFIKGELDSALKARDIYDSTQQKTIIGHSLGGLFSSYMILKDSTFFQNYVSLSPVLFWDDFEFFSQEKELRAGLLTKSTSVFLGVGQGEDLGVNNGTLRWKEILEENYSGISVNHHLAKGSHTGSMNENMEEVIKYLFP